MGAKTAMGVALKHPDLVKLLIAVDNAPVDASLSSDFPRYVRAMKEIEHARVKKQSEADSILSKEEEVNSILYTSLMS